MGIPIARSYTATTTGIALRHVTCEFCGTAFVYILSRQGIGEATSVLFLDNAGAEQRSVEVANAELARQLAEDIDPIPCPRCGKYQTAMFGVIRNGKYGWMPILAGLSFAAALAAFIALTALQFDFSVMSQFTRTLICGALLGGQLLGFVLRKWWQRRCEKFNPNAGNRTKAQLIDQERTMLLDEFEHEGPGRLLLAVENKHREQALADVHGSYVIGQAAGLSLAGIGLGLLVWMWQELDNGIRSPGWPVAEAMLLTANVAAENEQKHGQSITRYSPAVQYRYEADGREFTGSKYRLDPHPSNSQAEAESLVQGMLKDPHFRIHYKQSDPAVSVVVPGLSRKLYATIIIIVGVIVGGCGIFAFAFWRYRGLGSLSAAATVNQ